MRSIRLTGMKTKLGITVIAALVLGGGTAVAMTATHGNLGFNQASPTAHSGGHEDDQDDTACTTRTPGQDDREGSATRTPGHESDHECEKGEGTRTPEPTERPEGAHTPEPTERPEGTHTPQATGTPGRGD